MAQGTGSRVSPHVPTLFLQLADPCHRFIVTDDKEGPDSVFQQNIKDVSVLLFSEVLGLTFP